ncbi:putative nucleoside hydrolase [Natrialba magadii ATCC 43099]|uniref:Nucleoside hydrolase n=1 Tax=Natrialba magadii (strain ATCC 43099 / DSM 3394 / CCM 3739 / CIP 104546 / IAM 13178 / JCM 8861 / NBRC 102185 / NCIMB 2190 / MS3) TaxID=547559 RepID=D3SSY9_NATMM|nr:nucleoside hydrolase [Natrialba magadii]ADD04935.1 putative nucleoside hydrolase [Natrialba magadii ATCC 43099]ELY23983.1 inosine/uridine-preferring nucleoside hydrolase [Natrialba magadii ATCC 43099]
MSRPVLFDTDPGCDDAVAITLALASDDLEVVGLSTAHGNTTVENTTANARSILELVDRTDVPVARGADCPLTVDLETAEHIHGPDGILGDLPEPTAATEPVDAPGAQFIVEQAREHAGDLTLVAIAPLTNVALALALEPDLPELLDELVVMGGAAFGQGNVTPLAEANFHSDPHAAHRVVRDLSPTIVGLDVTRGATFPPDRLPALSRDGQLEWTIRQWLTYYDEEQLARYDIESAAIHDALVVAWLLDDGILEIEPCAMRVGTDNDLARGALVCDARGVTERPPNGYVATAVDTARFRSVLGEGLEFLLQ